MTYPAGLLNSRVRFERRSTGADDGFGNTLQSWATICTVAAGFMPERGKEAVEAGRLESTLRGVITVHRSAMTKSVLPDDRAVFLTGPFVGKTFNVRSIMPRPDGATLEFTAETGVAT